MQEESVKTLSVRLKQHQADLEKKGGVCARGCLQRRSTFVGSFVRSSELLLKFTFGESGSSTAVAV